MASQKIDLIRQALSAADSSIKLARQLLNDIEKDGPKNKQPQKDSPGVVGVFDGQSLTIENGEKHPVPENYASKSILVVGDTLKLVEEGKEKRFKQIEHVKRHKTTGILTKKEGKWAAVTPEGSYKILPAAVAHFDGDVGDEALLQIPAGNLQVPWAAVEKITKRAGGGKIEIKEESEAEKDKKEEKPKEEKPKKEQITKKEEKVKTEAPKEPTEPKLSAELPVVEVPKEVKVEEKEPVSVSQGNPDGGASDSDEEELA